MSLIKHINRLIQLSALADAEERRLEEKRGLDTSLGFDPFDPEATEWAFEPGHEKKKLQNYLNQLDDDTLLKLEALMYFGRDEDDFQEILRDLSDRNESKREIVKTIVEKRSAYPVYFQKALNALKEKSVDIDSI